MELERAISLYASAISNYAKLKKEVTGGRSSGTTHKGFTHLKNVDHYAVAAHILKVNWHGKTAASAAFDMGERAQALLHINLDWQDRLNLGRYLFSALTMSHLYHMDKDNPDDINDPWLIVATGKEFKVHWKPHNISEEPFPKWTAPYDQYGNRLLQASWPCPPNLEYKPPFPDTESTPWLQAVHKLESVGYRINDEVLELADKLKNKLVPKNSLGRPDFDRHLQMAKELKGKTFYQRVSVDFRGRFSLPEFSYQGSDFCRAVIEFADGRPINKKGFDNLLVHTQNHRGMKDTYLGRRDSGLEHANDYIHLALDPVASFKDWKNVDKPLCFIRSCIEIRDFAVPIRRFQYQTMDAEQLKRYSKTTNVKDARAWFKKYLKRYDDLELGGTDWSGDYYTVTDDYPEVLEDGSTPNWGGKDLDIPPDYYGTYEKHFYSHLPIEIDQSSSWAQHMVLMLRRQGDEDLRNKLSLGDGKFYRDVYWDIGQQLDIPVDEITKRKLVKKVAMPWGYGASTQTCQEDLIKFRDENFSKKDWFGKQDDTAVKTLAKTICALLRKEISVRKPFNKKVKDACNAVMNQGKKNYLQWTTPFGFVVHQRMHETQDPQVRLFTGHYGYKPMTDALIKVRKPTDEIAWPRPNTRPAKTMRQSVPPNLIHSYDAGLIHGTLAYGQFWWHRKKSGELVVAGHHYHDDEDIPATYDVALHEPRYPIITIHDAFACHANEVDELRSDLKFNFIQMYGMFDPLNRFLYELEVSKVRPTQHHDDDWGRLAPIFT